MKLVKVQLTLWFSKSETADMMFAKDMDEVEKIETAHALMDDNETFNWQTYIMKFDPKGFVEYLCSFGEVKEAKWLPDNKIEYTMEINDETCSYCEDSSDEGIVRHVFDELLDNSLEDSEYESCDENGWIIMTKPLADGTTYEYGLIDYRSEKNICVSIV